MMKEMHGTDSMGETAENIAKERPHITREKQDAFALLKSSTSHCRH